MKKPRSVEELLNDSPPVGFEIFVKAMLVLICLLLIIGFFSEVGLYWETH